MKIIDRGTLLQTANVNRLPLEKTIIYPVFYADDVHFGRLPGDLPPIESIKGWVRRKLQVKDEKEVTKIAWAIGKHIEKYGTEPRPFLMNAVDSVKQELKG
jgi:hypothetical protein